MRCIGGVETDKQGLTVNNYVTAGAVNDAGKRIRLPYENPTPIHVQNANNPIARHHIKNFLGNRLSKRVQCKLSA